MPLVYSNKANESLILNWFWFNSWHDVHEYCETNDGSDIKPLVKLVDDHGTEPLKKALAKITLIEQADYVFQLRTKPKAWNGIVCILKMITNLK